MKLLEERIIKDGVVKAGNVLKVDAFLNHQIDIRLYNEMGKEWKRLFEGEEVTKILTIEASGIGMAVVAAQYFDVPVVFAKKNRTLNLDGDLYCTKVESFTHSKFYNVFVSKKFLNENDKVLIIDDFLANGNALMGLIDIVEQAGAVVTGIGIAVEKQYQNGGEMIRKKGYRIESLAKIKKMGRNYIEFEQE